MRKWAKEKLGGFITGVSHQVTATLLAIPLLLWMLTTAVKSFQAPDPVIGFLPHTYTWGSFSIYDYPYGAGVILGDDEYFYYVNQPLHYGLESDVWHTIFKAKLNEFSDVPDGLYVVEFIFWSEEQRQDSYVRHGEVSYGSVTIEVVSYEQRREIVNALSQWEWFIAEIHTSDGIARSRAISLQGSAIAVSRAQWFCRVIRGQG